MSRRKESRQHRVHGLASSCQIPVAYTWRSLIEGLRQPRSWFTRSREAKKRNDLRILVAHAEARVLNLEPFAEQRLAMRAKSEVCVKRVRSFVSTCNGRASEQRAFACHKNSE